MINSHRDCDPESNCSDVCLYKYISCVLLFIILCEKS